MMKKYRFLVCGLICGLFIGISSQTFAADAVKHVTASINETFQFIVNGEKTDLPKEYELLVYNNRSYLPVRAVSDMVGTEVEWDENSKTITLTTSSKDKDSEADRYSPLPRTKEDGKYRLTLTTYGRGLGTDKLSRIFFRLTSFADETIRIQPSKITLIADGKTYTNYSSDVDLSMQDKKLYTSYLSKDEEMDSYITLPEKIKNADKIYVEIPVVLDTYRGQQTEMVSFCLDVSDK